MTSTARSTNPADLRRETYRTAFDGDRSADRPKLAVGVGDNPRESLSELARLGVWLIIQRAVEDEFDAWLGGLVMNVGP